MIVFVAAKFLKLAICFYQIIDKAKQINVHRAKRGAFSGLSLELFMHNFRNIANMLNIFALEIQAF